MNLRAPFLLLILWSVTYPFAPVCLHAQSDSLYHQRVSQQIKPLRIPYSPALAEMTKQKERQAPYRMKETMAVFYSYQPLFAQALSKYELPPVFQYIPLVISKMDIRYQEGGLRGFWGLSYLEGVRYGLRMDSMYDERYDPQLSSEAAAAILHRLYQSFEGDAWETFLAYVSSPAAVRAAKIRLRSDYPSPYALQEQLRLSQGDAIDDLLSWLYISHFGKFSAEKNPPSSLHSCLWECQNPIYASQLRQCLAIDERTFLRCNPSLLAEKIPAHTQLGIPAGKAETCQRLADSLYQLYAEQHRLDSIAKALTDSVQRAQDSLKNAQAAANKKSGQTVHTVKSGEVLGRIAAKYGVTVADIKRWNHLKSDLIQIGQKLIIYR
ncbi:MAG: LysM peptidoglycan-binding domain-containing protein [Bacteroidales bacterium]|nr:LysM peptidoglycan-binding domain-containing protein [Bacteroidales bacterium]